MEKKLDTSISATEYSLEWYLILFNEMWNEMLDDFLEEYTHFHKQEFVEPYNWNQELNARTASYLNQYYSNLGHGLQFRIDTQMQEKQVAKSILSILQSSNNGQNWKLKDAIKTNFQNNFENRLINKCVEFLSKEVVIDMSPDEQAENAIVKILEEQHNELNLLLLSPISIPQLIKVLKPFYEDKLDIWVVQEPKILEDYQYDILHRAEEVYEQSSMH